MENYEYSLIGSFLEENKDILNLNYNEINNNLKIVPLRGGSTNLNYRLEINNNFFFLKHQRDKNDSIFYKDALEREYEVTKFLSDEFALAPAPIIIDINKRLLMNEFVRGRTPSVTDKDFFNTLALIGNSLNLWRDAPVDLLKRLNTETRICPHNFFKKIIIPTTGTIANQLLRDGSPGLFQFLEEISGIITERLKYEPISDCKIDWKMYEESPKSQPYGLLHNDLALRNIIITENEKNPIYFIDWEMADFGDISFDFAYLQSENMILQQQLEIISSFGNFNPYIKERTNRYTKIFLPMLELANAYWTIDHIGKMVDGTIDKKVKLRPPYSLFQNLNFIRSKIKRLERLSSMSNNGHKDREVDLFNELQYALKIFESQLIYE